MSFYVKLQGKEVLEKLFVVLDFSPKILYEAMYYMNDLCN